MTDVRKDELAVSDGGATLNVPTKTGSCNRSAECSGLRVGKFNRGLMACGAPPENSRKLLNRPWCLVVKENLKNAGSWFYHRDLQKRSWLGRRGDCNRSVINGRRWLRIWVLIRRR